MEKYTCPRCNSELYYIRFLDNNKMKCLECNLIGNQDKFFKNLVDETWINSISKTDEEKKLMSYFNQLSQREKLLLFQWLEITTNKQMEKLS